MAGPNTSIKSPSSLSQCQVDREKQAYDFESLQSQLDKALGMSARFGKERDTAQLEADRFHDKYEKSQVRYADDLSSVYFWS